MLHILNQQSIDSRHFCLDSKKITKKTETKQIKNSFISFSLNIVTLGETEEREAENEM
jgi:hypothetical protein